MSSQLLLKLGLIANGQGELSMIFFSGRGKKIVILLLCSLLAACQTATGAFALDRVSPVDAGGGRRPKIALVLGGGGARGAAHVGVLRELEKAGIHIDMITGTSIGAIVGGLYCAGLSVDEIESKFRKPTIMRNYMTVPLVVSICARPIFLLPRLIGIRPYDGFYFGNKFRNYYRSCLPKDKQRIENLNIPFRAMTVNLMTGDPYPIDHGDLPRAVQASSAIPVLRRPVPFEDVVLVDGAVLINVPVDEARTMGADFVIAVPVNERLNFEERNYFRKLGSVARRIEKIFLAKNDIPQLNRADIVIHPQTDGIDILSTSPKDADKAIDAGEDAARAAIPEIKAKLAAWQAPAADVKTQSPPAN
jgi:NTE family protein